MGLVDDCRSIGLRDDPTSAEALTPAAYPRPLANILYRASGKFDLGLSNVDGTALAGFGVAGSLFFLFDS